MTTPDPPSQSARPSPPLDRVSAPKLETPRGRSEDKGIPSDRQAPPGYSKAEEPRPASQPRKVPDIYLIEQEAIRLRRLRCYQAKHRPQAPDRPESDTPSPAESIRPDPSLAQYVRPPPPSDPTYSKVGLRRRIKLFFRGGSRKLP